jgi:transcriptional regulator with XRE-family HTH domain
MSRARRPEFDSEAERRNREQCARLGGEVRASRRRRRLTQKQLGARIGVVQSTISVLERGRGASLSIDVWQRAFTTLGRRLVLDASRDPSSEPTDAGHLAMQEFVIGVARRAGFDATFELPTTPTDPRRSTDVGLRDDARRLLVLVECWNTIGDLGASVRSTNRKLIEAGAAAIAFGGDRPHGVGGCWVVRASAANRALVARYPEIFGRQFPGSSLAWCRALTTQARPPGEAGLVWFDPRPERLVPWRRRARR